MIEFFCCKFFAFFERMFSLAIWLIINMLTECSAEINWYLFVFLLHKEQERVISDAEHVLLEKIFIGRSGIPSKLLKYSNISKFLKCYPLESSFYLIFYYFKILLEYTCTKFHLLEQKWKWWNGKLCRKSDILNIFLLCKDVEELFKYSLKLDNIDNQLFSDNICVWKCLYNMKVKRNFINKSFFNLVNVQMKNIWKDSFLVSCIHLHVYVMMLMFLYV